jgi:hypothetical protein
MKNRLKAKLARNEKLPLAPFMFAKPIVLVEISTRYLSGIFCDSKQLLLPK